MNLIIDDERTLGCDLIARTPEAGKKVLRYMWQKIDMLCIDHDLGFGENGCDVIKWAIENECLPTKVQIVTMNPVGRKNIADVLVHDAWYTHVGNQIYLPKVMKR